jgi:hypothetical protein
MAVVGMGSSTTWATNASVVSAWVGTSTIDASANPITPAPPTMTAGKTADRGAISWPRAPMSVTPSAATRAPGTVATSPAGKKVQAASSMAGRPRTSSPAAPARMPDETKSPRAAPATMAAGWPSGMRAPTGASRVPSWPR